MGKLYDEPKRGCPHAKTHVVQEHHPDFIVNAIVCSNCNYVVETSITKR